MGYQDTNFKICLSLFGCEELKLHNVHIVHCSALFRLARESGTSAALTARTVLEEWLSLQREEGEGRVDDKVVKQQVDKQVDMENHYFAFITCHIRWVD